MGERICVLKAGTVQQVDKPTILYERPANAFVAGFIGTPAMNLLPATVTPGGLLVGTQRIALAAAAQDRLGAPGGRLLVGVRPEAFGEPTPSGLDAMIDPSTREILGSETLARGDAGGEPVTVRLPGLVRDVPPRLTAPLAALHFFAADEAGIRL